MTLEIAMRELRLDEVCRFVYRGSPDCTVQLDPACLERVQASHRRLHELIEKRLPIYGVTTGFGDSCARFVDPQNGERLQANLVSYLLAGSGALLPVDACRAMFVIRLKSLSRGFSGVSPELLDRMRLYLENDWIPAVPCEGSLGASGDLIPLAYLARVLQGQGQIFVAGELRPTESVLKAAGVEPYRLKVKEGLALVNGTSAMAGLCTANLMLARELIRLSTFATTWLCMAIRGRTEPYGPLVNQRAGNHKGQIWAADQVLSLLSDESYKSAPLSEMRIENSLTAEQVQDRYSLRCAPQILGPVVETVTQFEQWLEDEINSTSDNPLIEGDGSLGMGGNFYGGYLSQGMDYLKISLAQMTDMLDRQLINLIDDKANRGLPPNLANWPGLAPDERHLHHGLKGLHQSVGALTSEIMSKAMPNGIFSRSSESHNQDKVSLGMSAAVQCMHMNEQVLTVMSLYFICLAQALDLRGIQLKGERSKKLYQIIRAAVPFVSHDQPLDTGIQKLRAALRERAQENWRRLNETV